MPQLHRLNPPPHAMAPFQRSTKPSPLFPKSTELFRRTTETLQGGHMLCCCACTLQRHNPPATTLYTPTTKGDFALQYSLLLCSPYLRCVNPIVTFSVSPSLLFSSLYNPPPPHCTAHFPRLLVKHKHHPSAMHQAHAAFAVHVLLCLFSTTTVTSDKVSSYTNSYSPSASDSPSHSASSTPSASTTVSASTSPSSTSSPSRTA